jgi:phosphate-selective porin OprO/OprP
MRVKALIRAGGALLVTAGMLATLRPAAAAEGQQAPDAPTLLEERIRALEQRLAEDEASLQAAREAAAQADAAAKAAAAKAAPPAAGAPAAAAPVGPANALSGSFGADGFTLRSADGANMLHLRGNVSVDGRYFSDDITPIAADTWLVRRLRPTFEGTIANQFDFRFMPDFGLGKSIVQDAWADARITPALVLTFGKFKAPVGLERLQLEQFARFIEPSLTADLLPYRDLGAKIGGSVAGGVFGYDIGVFDGTPDAGSTDGNATPDANSTGRFSWEGRVFAKPFLHAEPAALRGLGVGLAATYVKYLGVASPTATNSLLASYKTTGQQPLLAYRANTVSGGAFNNASIADGIERRWVPQLYYALGPVSLLSEYVREDQQMQRQIAAGSYRNATVRATAWQLQAAVFLTGESESFDAATPRRDVGRGGAGAWELVARVHALRFDDDAFADGVNSFANLATAPKAAHALGLGVNWYLNRNVKAQLDYEVTRFDGGASSGDRPDERVLTSQFALVF